MTTFGVTEGTASAGFTAEIRRPSWVRPAMWGRVKHKKGSVIGKARNA